MSVLPQLTTLGNLVKSLYGMPLRQVLRRTRQNGIHLPPPLRIHARDYVRECRIRAYAQLLESYRSLTIESLVAALGELSRYISSGHLSCTIDKVNVIVSTTRGGDTGKEKQYDSGVMKGDVLLGKMQRLSKVLY